MEKNNNGEIHLAKWSENTSKVYEEINGIPLTLYDSNLRSISKRKDGKYTIEPIISLRNAGSNRVVDDYSTTMIQKGKYLAVLIEEKDVNRYDERNILTFEHLDNREFGLFARKDKKKDSYSLLDYSFKNIIQNSATRLVLVELSDTDVYTISDFIGSTEEAIKTDKRLKSININTGIYIDASGIEMPPAVQKYLTTFEKLSNDDFALTTRHFYIMPYINIKGISGQLKKDYQGLIRSSTLVGYKNMGNNSYSIHPYNEATKSMLANYKYKFGHLIKDLDAEIAINGVKYCDEIRNAIIEVYKTPEGYIIPNGEISKQTGTI